MNTVDIVSLPKMQFAHIYGAQAYSAQFPVKKNFMEISYIEEGALNITVEMEHFHVQKGDVICFLRQAETIISTDVYHCHHTIGATLDWHFADQGHHGLNLPVVLPKDNVSANIYQLIDNMIHKQLLYKSSDAHFAAKFLELLCEIDKCNTRSKNNHLPSEIMYVKRIKDYVQKNIQSPITQASVAEYLQITPGHLCYVFKKVEGITFMQYINRIKLENIKTLMDNKSIHLYEAASLFGYTDPNYVSRLFKKYYGYNITDKPRIHPEI